MGTITFLGEEYPIIVIDNKLHVEFWWYVEHKYDNGIVSCTDRCKVRKIVPWDDAPKVMRKLFGCDGRIIAKQGEEPF